MNRIFTSTASIIASWNDLVTTANFDIMKLACGSLKWKFLRRARIKFLYRGLIKLVSSGITKIMTVLIYLQFFGHNQRS